MSDYSEIIDYYAVLMAVQHESKCVYHAPATEKEAAPPELSPAAKAVLDAAMQYEINPECYTREIAAAALHAAADQLCLRWAELSHPADVLNNIADELEGNG